MYDPGRKELWLNGNCETDDYLFETVRHEGFHQFVDFHFGRTFPTWLNEGLAMYFETAQRTKTGLRHGWAKPWIVEELASSWNKESRPNLGWLMSASYNDFHCGVEGGGTEKLNYKTSWLLCAWLIEDAPKGPAILNEFIDGLVKGKAPSLADSLGDLSRVEAEMCKKLDSMRARIKPDEKMVPTSEKKSKTKK
jgi:hypothetical protein